MNVERAAFLAQVVEGTVVVGKDGIAILAGECREPAVCVRLAVVQPDVARDCRGVMFAPGVLATLLVLIDQVLSVVARLYSFGRRLDQLKRTPTCSGDLIELRLRARRKLTVARFVAA